MKNNSSIWRKAHNVFTFFLISAVFFLGYSLDKRAKGDSATDHTIKVAAKKVLKNTDEVEKLRDTVTKYLETLRHDTIPNPPLTIHDTLDLYHRLMEHKAEAVRTALRLNDSIYLLTGLKNSLSKEIFTLKEARKHLVLQGVKTILKADSNADIAVVPFKKKERQNVFSPQKNFLRVYNRVPGGTINSLPFYDYEQTNDELNLLLFQARTSYNFTNHRFQYGPGIELKINRFSFNAAQLFNSDNDPFKSPTFSLGAKFDIYRVRFK